MAGEAVSPGEAIAAARAARDAGIAMAEEADRSGWDRALIEQAIAAFAATMRPFSANDIRPLLGDVRTALMGGRFIAAAHAGVIRRVGRTASRKENTHLKDIGRWIGVPPDDNHDDHL